MSWLAIFKCSQTKREEPKGKQNWSCQFVPELSQTIPFCSQGWRRGGGGGGGGVLSSSSSFLYFSASVIAVPFLCLGFCTSLGLRLEMTTLDAKGEEGEGEGGRWQIDILKSFTIYCGRGGKCEQVEETDWLSEIKGSLSSLNKKRRMFPHWSERDACCSFVWTHNVPVHRSDGDWEADLFSVTCCSMRCCIAICLFALQTNSHNA